jgi:MYND finger
VNQKGEICMKSFDAFTDSMARCAATYCSNTRAEGKKLQACARCGRAAYCSKACQKQHWPVHKGTCSSGTHQITLDKTGAICTKPFNLKAFEEKNEAEGQHTAPVLYGCVYMDTGEDLECVTSQLRLFDHQLSTLYAAAAADAPLSFDVIATPEQLHSHAAHAMALAVVQYTSKKKTLRALPCTVGVTINERNRPAQGRFSDKSDKFEQWLVFARTEAAGYRAGQLTAAVKQCAVPAQVLSAEHLAEYLQHHRAVAAGTV